MTPLDPTLYFFIHLFAKFELSTFNHFHDISGSQNSKNGSRDPHMTRFDPILYFFRNYFLPSTFVPNMKLLASTTLNILGSPTILKVGHVNPTWHLLT